MTDDLIVTRPTDSPETRARKGYDGRGRGGYGGYLFAAAPHPCQVSTSIQALTRLRSRFE